MLTQVKWGKCTQGGLPAGEVGGGGVMGLEAKGIKQ